MKRDGRDRTDMANEFTGLLTPGQIPESDRLILTGGSEQLAVWMETHPPNFTLVSTERLDTLSGLCVPNLYRFIMTY
jgi:hypothetical protein